MSKAMSDGQRLAEMILEVDKSLVPEMEQPPEEVLLNREDWAELVELAQEMVKEAPRG